MKFLLPYDYSDEANNAFFDEAEKREEHFIFAEGDDNFGELPELEDPSIDESIPVMVRYIVDEIL